MTKATEARKYLSNFIVLVEYFANEFASEGSQSYLTSLTDSVMNYKYVRPRVALDGKCANNLCPRYEVSHCPYGFRLQSDLDLTR